MEEVLELLRRMKDLDEDIKKNEQQLKEIPPLISKLQKEIEKANNQLKFSKNRTQEIKKVYKLKEGDIAENEEKINKLSQQIYSVKTNEEYRAIIKEIEYLKALNRKIEDEMIGLLEEEEQLKNSLGKLEQETNEITEKKTSEIESLKKKEQELNEKLETEKFTFQDQLKKLPEDIRSLYLRIRKVREKAICVVTDEGICTGCYFNLTPQTLNELRKKGQIILCDNCGRILIYGS